MYARHRIGVIVPASEEGFLRATISAIPEYVDRIYVAANGNRDFSDGRITYIGSTEESSGALYARILDDCIDIAAIKSPSRPLEPRYLSYLLDPIIWGDADYTKGSQYLTPILPGAGNGNGSFNHAFIVSQVTLSARSPEEYDPSAGEIALSRRAMELILAEKTRPRRTGRTLAAIPCYNEALAIGSVVLKAQKYVDEVLVIDDGSTDDTVKLARGAGAKVVQHGSNRGYGCALRTCFEYARAHDYDAMVIMDGDGQHDPAAVPDLLEAMDSNGADIVIGSRFLKEDPAVPLYRRLGIKVLDVAARLMGGVAVSDSQSGYRAYNRRAIGAIQFDDDAMGAGFEILSAGAAGGLSIAEVPIRVRYDIAGTSTQNPLAHAYDVLGTIVLNMTRKRPLLFFGLPGFAATTAGIFLGMLLLYQFNESHAFSLPVAMLASVLSIVGVMAMFMGIALTLMVRIQHPALPPAPANGEAR